MNLSAGVRGSSWQRDSIPAGCILFGRSVGFPDRLNAVKVAGVMIVGRHVGIGLQGLCYVGLTFSTQLQQRIYGNLKQTRDGFCCLPWGGEPTKKSLTVSEITWPGQEL